MNFIHHLKNDLLWMKNEFSWTKFILSDVGDGDANHDVIYGTTTCLHQ
jgi:hypothetical membrane protein